MHVISPNKASSDITYTRYTIYISRVILYIPVKLFTYLEREKGWEVPGCTKRQDPVLHLSKLKVDKENNKTVNKVNTQRDLLLACFCRFIYSISLNLLP